MGKWTTRKGKAHFTPDALLKGRWVIENGKTIFKKKTPKGGRGTNQFAIKPGGKVRTKAPKAVKCKWVTLKDGRRICLGDDGGKYIRGKSSERALVPIGGSGSKWKPLGTKEEAEAFVKNSKVKTTLYHGTSSPAYDTIVKDGFKPGQSDAYGKAIYFTNNKSIANRFKASKSDLVQVSPGKLKLDTGKVASVKINVRKPLVTTPQGWDKLSSKYGQTRTDFYKFIEKDIRPKYDSVVIEHSTGINYAIFDPKKIMVFK
jgi:hypothetical protein